jgi:hypothetical protein
VLDRCERDDANGSKNAGTSKVCSGRKAHDGLYPYVDYTDCSAGMREFIETE